MTASLSIVRDIAPRTDFGPTLTLLDLVTELNATGASDREVVAAVLDLLETGRVKLIGQVCEADLLTH